MSGVLRIAIVVGVTLGVFYTISPLTIMFACAMAWASWLALRDLGTRERRWVSAALVIAIVARMLAIAALLLATDPVREQFLAWFPDARYAIVKSWWIRNLWFGIPIGPMAMFGIYDTYGASSFAYFLAAVQSIFGAAPYGVDLMSVAALVLGALILFRLTRRAYGPGPAIVALLVILFWPTMMAWSVSVLREASQFFLVTVVLACTVAVVRESRWRRKALAAVGAAATIYAIGTLRAGAVIIVALAIPLGLALRLATVRAWVAAATAVCVLALGFALAMRTDVRAFVEYQTDLAANRHLGQASTPGRSYKLLDRRFYEQGPQSTFTVTREEAVRFFARSAAAFVFWPVPWRAASVSELAIAPQQCIWYVLVVLAILGVRAAWQRDALLTALLASYAVAGLVVIAPNSGNTGTLVRHRDMIAPVVACLAGVGLMTLFAKIANLRTPDPSRSSTRVVGLASRRALRSIVDEQGRLVGRLNPIDAAGVITVLLSIFLTVSTVRVFQPVSPVIDKIEPSVLESANRRLRLQGHDFRQYLRVFVAPSGRPLVLTDPVHQNSEAAFRLRTRSDVELDVPAEAEPGTYDLYVYDEGREVMKRSPAFTVAAGNAQVLRRPARVSE